VDDWARCGTVACVAGHAAAVVTARGEPVRPEDIRSVATTALGLDYDQALWLFWLGHDKSDVVSALTAIADGGEGGS